MKTYILTKDSNRDLLFKAYKFWHSVWYTTYQELESCEKLYSDGFLDAKYIITVFENNECVGTSLLTQFDLSNLIHKEHSYFKAYSINSLEKLSKSFTNVLSIGSVAIHPEYRKMNLLELLIEESYKVFLRDNAQAMIAYTRNNRKVNDVSYKLGAFPIERDLINHNCKTDILYFDKENFNFNWRKEYEKAS